jgi:hypothetical protein
VSTHGDDNNSCVCGQHGQREAADRPIRHLRVFAFQLFCFVFFKFSIKAGKENMMDHVVREILLTT